MIFITKRVEIVQHLKAASNISFQSMVFSILHPVTFLSPSTTLFVSLLKIVFGTIDSKISIPLKFSSSATPYKIIFGEENT